MNVASQLAIISSVLLFSSPMSAFANGSGDAKITARVPTVCDIAPENFVLTESGRVAGSVREFCNTSTVYQIFATYRPLAANEAGTIRYGSSSTSLDQTGLSMVAVRQGQRLEDVAVEINTQSLSSPLAISFTLSTF